MVSYAEVPPDTLSIRLTEGGIAVEYLDNREVFYRGVPESVQPPHQTAPGKDVHVLVTDGTETSGMLMYVDERTTEGEILEASGVGRILLDQDERRTIFPGVEVHRVDLRCEIDVDRELVDGRVFVFEEDQFGEQSYELTASQRDMTEETERVWLVERSYGTDEDLVTLVYATADGRRKLTKQLSHRLIRRKEITAGREVQSDRLTAVTDEGTRDRYADEAARVAATHDPDDPI